MKADGLFQEYKKEYSPLDPEVVWEYSFIGNHYQVMLTEADETFSISLAPNSYIPWALRNAVHPQSSDFVVVDGITVSVESIMKLIDKYLGKENFREQIINHVIIRSQFENLSEKEKARYLPTTEQFQKRFDNWRLEQDLGKVSSYDDYLINNGLDQSIVEKELSNELILNNYLDSLSLISAKQYFSVYSDELIRYKIESYIAESEDEANDLTEFLQNQPDGLCVWARKRFLEESDYIARKNYQLNTCWYSQLDAEVAEVMANNPKTGLLPPIEMNGKWTFVNILAITPPVLDQQTEAIIRQRQVSEWINEKKKTCSIQWLWGDKDIFPDQNIQES